MALPSANRPRATAQEIIARVYKSHAHLDSLGKRVEALVLSNSEQSITALVDPQLLSRIGCHVEGTPIRAQLIWTEYRGLRGWRILGAVRPTLSSSLAPTLIPSGFNANLLTRVQLSVYCSAAPKELMNQLIGPVILNPDVAHFMTRSSANQGTCRMGFSSPLHEAMCCISLHGSCPAELNEQYHISQAALLLRRIFIDPQPIGDAAPTTFLLPARLHVEQVLNTFKSLNPECHAMLMGLVFNRAGAIQRLFTKEALTAFHLAIAHAEHSQAVRLGLEAI